MDRRSTTASSLIGAGVLMIAAVLGATTTTQELPLWLWIPIVAGSLLAVFGLALLLPNWLWKKLGGISMWCPIVWYVAALLRQRRHPSDHLNVTCARLVFLPMQGGENSSVWTYEFTLVSRLLYTLRLDTIVVVIEYCSHLKDAAGESAHWSREIVVPALGVVRIPLTKAPLSDAARRDLVSVSKTLKGPEPVGVRIAVSGYSRGRRRFSINKECVAQLMQWGQNNP